MTSLVDKLVPDPLWAIVQALLPPPPRPPYGGRHRTIPDRNCFAAIVYMARTSTPWRLLPARELGCGSPTTVWRRLDEWAKAGMFEALHLEILDRLGEQGRLDWSRASLDSASVRAKRGDHVGANPVDRGKPGSKLHLACERGGLPLAATITAANVNDTLLFVALLEDVPAVLTSSGRRRSRPATVDADKAYDHAVNRGYLRRRGIRPRIARRGVESSSRLGRHRWRIERTLSWLSCYRRLGVRWDRGSERWFAFVLLACALVCFNRLEEGRCHRITVALPDRRAPRGRLEGGCSGGRGRSGSGGRIVGSTERG